MIKTAYHPDGDHIIRFKEESHIYRDNYGKQYVSATTFVGKFFPQFDAVAVSKQCAASRNPKYSGRTPEDIRAEWNAEGDRGRGEGTNTHLYAEGRMCGLPADQLPAPMSDRCAGLFAQVDEAVRFLLNQYVFIGAEVIVFSPRLGLAGMIDLLMFDPAYKALIFFDWKQNKRPFSMKNTRQNAFPPIDHLHDCDIAHYSLQLSLYETIVRLEDYFPGITSFRRELIHLTPLKYTIVPLEYYDYEINEMVKYDGRK